MDMQVENGPPPKLTLLRLTANIKAFCLRPVCVSLWKFKKIVLTFCGFWATMSDFIF